ncbi:hypothetical protein HHK36_022475 [Tetracentron sinense]|uniref:G3BP-like protein n=1 Tax=Tetracentron sinense TaxID=13715 RepID=A0A835D648_TETSI|nr:hypothetical protein HHK36_022475 [Tetracentron sinense]
MFFQSAIMATSFPGSVSAIQVGSYFVGQYYQVLQQQPDFVYQFYTDASTMLRIDGNTSESASAMVQIRTLIMSLSFTGIEIKTAHSLESWNGGVLVMVSGSIQTKDFSGRRKFMQTFFLAPQEKGYFVLNDIFHFVDEEQIHQHPAAILAQNDLYSKLNASNSLPEPVSDYMHREEIQAREFVASVHIEENDPVDKYSLPEQQQQQVSEAENIVEEIPAEESTASFQSAMSSERDPLPAPVEEPVEEPVGEPVGEPPKKTYASIVAKGQYASSIAPKPSFNKTISPTSEWHQAPLPTTQQFYPSSVTAERSGTEAAEDVLALEEEGELRSVFVRNLPSTVSASDIEQEFKNFGRIKPDSVIIRNRQDSGVCYAFVEFEDALGVQTAIKASPILFAGRQIHIEERRANRSGTSGGRPKGPIMTDQALFCHLIPSAHGKTHFLASLLLEGRGRGRGSYQNEGPMKRFGGRSFGRGSGQDGSDRDYNRMRGNGFHQQGPQQYRGILGNQGSRNEQNPSVATT